MTELLMVMMFVFGMNTENAKYNAGTEPVADYYEETIELLGDEFKVYNVDAYEMILSKFKDLELQRKQNKISQKQYQETMQNWVVGVYKIYKEKETK